jgi:hypothetical protein
MEERNAMLALPNSHCNLCKKKKSNLMMIPDKGMVVLIKDLWHERHKLFLSKTFD